MHAARRTSNIRYRREALKGCVPAQKFGEEQALPSKCDNMAITCVVVVGSSHFTRRSSFQPSEVGRYGLKCPNPNRRSELQTGRGSALVQHEVFGCCTNPRYNFAARLTAREQLTVRLKVDAGARAAAGPGHRGTAGGLAGIQRARLCVHRASVGLAIFLRVVAYSSSTPVSSD